MNPIEVYIKKVLLRFLRLSLMSIGIAIELMLIPIAWAVRFVEEHTDNEANDG